MSKSNKQLAGVADKMEVVKFYLFRRLCDILQLTMFILFACLSYCGAECVILDVFWRMYFCYLGFDAIRMHFLAAKIARNTGSFGEIYGSHTLSM